MYQIINDTVTKIDSSDPIANQTDIINKFFKMSIEEQFKISMFSIISKDDQNYIINNFTNNVKYFISRENLLINKKQEKECTTNIEITLNKVTDEDIDFSLENK